MATKEEIERRQVTAFLENFPEWSAIPVKQDPPEPDFYIEEKGKLIGIEHTRLIREPDENGFDPMAHAQMSQKIMSTAEEMYKQRSTVNMMVHVYFRNDYGLTRKDRVNLVNKDIDVLGRFIADFVIQNIPAETKQHLHFDSFDWNTGKRRFPIKIEGINITNIRHLNDSCWTFTQGGTVSEIFESSELKNRLAEKQFKSKRYTRNYDQIWLLMIEDGRDLTTYFAFEDDRATIEISSTFNRVFIFRMAEKVIVELKNICEPQKQWPCLD